MRKHFTQLLILTLCVVNSACYQADEYDNPDPDLLTLDTTAKTGVADGSTPVAIQASISKDAAKSKRTVVFKTTNGTFLGGKGDSVLRQADNNFTATAELVSTGARPAVVTAKAYGITASNKAQIEFERAYPSNIIVSVDSFAISNRFNSELTITASMKLDGGGKPSEGTPVTFNVYYPTNPAGQFALVGNFINGIQQAFSDANGMAHIRYSPGGVDYQGTLTVTASTPNQTTPSAPYTAITTIFLYKN